MKERPILFSGEMVRAILDGRKTQTRRIVKQVPEWVNQFKFTEITPPGMISGLGNSIIEHVFIRLPYGQIGDRLWVRETFCPDWAGHGPIYKADGGSAIEAGYPREPRWRPSIHMPRWASRITLEVTGIRVERLHDINNNDALSEGTPDLRTIENNWDLVRCYRELWESISGSESWAANPWVWVIEFKKI